MEKNDTLAPGIRKKILLPTGESTCRSNAKSVLRTLTYGASADAHGAGASTTGESGTGKSEVVSEPTKCGYCSAMDDAAETCKASDEIPAGLVLDTIRYPTEPCGTGTADAKLTPGA